MAKEGRRRQAARLQPAWHLHPASTENQPQIQNDRRITTSASYRTQRNSERRKRSCGQQHCRCRRRCRHRRQSLRRTPAHSLPQALNSLCLCKRRSHFYYTMQRAPRETNITASRGAAAVVALQRATILLFFNGRYLAAHRPPSYLPWTKSRKKEVY